MYFIHSSSCCCYRMGIKKSETTTQNSASKRWINAAHTFTPPAPFMFVVQRFRDKQKLGLTVCSTVRIRSRYQGYGHNLYSGMEQSGFSWQIICRFTYLRACRLTQCYGEYSVAGRNDSNVQKNCHVWPFLSQSQQREIR